MPHEHMEPAHQTVKPWWQEQQEAKKAPVWQAVVMYGVICAVVAGFLIWVVIR